MTNSPGENAPASGKHKRLDELDGLRGAAALLVVIYHFFARWTEENHEESLYPHGDLIFNLFPFIDVFGTYGVNLFFLISGFVIFMTLTKSHGLMDFGIKRAARLWPTMIFAATLTTFAIEASAIHERFASLTDWQVTPVEYFSSVFFVDPAFFGDLAGIPGLSWVDGVYWTLWVEIRFYILIAMIYWLSGQQKFLWIWIGVQVVSTILLLMKMAGPIAPHWSLDLVFQSTLLAWFSIGIIAYHLWKGELNAPVIVLAVLSLGTICLEAVYSGTHLTGATIPEQFLLYAAVLVTFWLAFALPALRALLRNPWVVALGLASYPLYMFHERIGVISMTWLYDLGLPVWIIPIFSMAGVIVAALLIHRFVERLSQRFILNTALKPAVAAQQRLGLLHFVHRKPPKA